MFHSVEFRMKVVTAVEAGMSQAEAARRYEVAPVTVRRWIRRRRAGESLEDKPRTGAPPILTPEDVRRLGTFVEADPSASLDHLVGALDSAIGKRVSTVTIRRALQKLGIRRVRPKVIGTDVEAAPTPDRYRGHHRREPSAGRYPSSLSDHEWQLLRNEFEPEGPRGRGRPRVHEPRELLDAIFYVIRTGCAWRYLPSEFPPWQTTYAAFRSWSAAGSFERMHHLLAVEWRVREGRTPQPTAVIVDSQTAKTTEKGGLEVTTAQNV